MIEARVLRPPLSRRPSDTTTPLNTPRKHFGTPQRRLNVPSEAIEFQLSFAFARDEPFPDYLSRDPLMIEVVLFSRPRLREEPAGSHGN